jgi:formiminotetrahydrofolate cyclodeaminase
MAGVREMTVSQFLKEAGDRTPTPGGGAIAALGGALGVSMALMAARFTTGKKKFAAVEPEIRTLIDELEDISSRLVDCVDADMAGYSAVNAAYNMPKETKEEQARREAAVIDACRNAAKPPQDTLAACRRALDIALRLAEIANPMLLSDVGVAAEMLAAAAGSAFLNVRENAKVIGDSEGEKMLAEAGALLEECRGAGSSVLRKIGSAE